MNFLTSSEKIEKLFEKYFQKTINLSIKDEYIKRGKFLLIKNCIIGNNYFFELTIERSKKLDLVRLPYPFLIEEYPEENLMYMDYRINALVKTKKYLLEDITSVVKKIDVKNTNKLFNNILQISFE